MEQGEVNDEKDITAETRSAPRNTVNERHKIISGRFRQAVSSFLILLTLLPVSSVQAADDPAWALLHQAQPGVNYDPDTQSWYFYGVPIEQVRYEMPGVSVDLVRVLFMGSEGVPYKVWVAVGMDMGAEYLALGPWETAEQAHAIPLRQMLLKVYISETVGTLTPQVDKHGIEWKNCDMRELCGYGQLFDIMHNDLSNLFIEYEIAPGWYPWGFLFWDVEIVSQYKRNTPNNYQWRVE